MRKPVIAGNWKMHLTRAQAVTLVKELRSGNLPAGVEVIVCPPFTALDAVAAAVGGSAVALGAQNMHDQSHGAFTGEVSAQMLTDLGCRYVILGHSERRTLFGETDAGVKRKVEAALAAGLAPIVCIGETLEQRDAGQTFAILERQLAGSLQSLPAAQWSRVMLAYEPVWAIGTGQNATPEQAQEAHAWIRKWIMQAHGPDAADTVRVQYGGSVNAGNAAGLLQQPDIDGALVGGASLKSDAFLAIIRSAADAKAVEKKCTS
jgi:triosephosphate isomerase